MNRLATDSSSVGSKAKGASAPFLRSGYASQTSAVDGPAIPDDRLTVALVMLGAAIWLASRPYLGIRHDATLYFGQVLLHGWVPALQNDPFFAAGSQDRFSIYSSLISAVYSVCGVAATHQLAVLGTQAASATAVWFILRRWVDRRWSAAGVLALACLSPFYGAGFVFSYGEPFLTARSFAEPLTLWGVVLLLAGHRLLAAGLLIAAASWHPLMAAPAICTAIVFAVLSHRRWLFLPFTLAAIVLGLALAGLPPWDGLLRRYDPYWWSLVEQANPNCLISKWQGRDLMIAAVDAALMCAAVGATTPNSRERRWLVASLIAGGTLLLLSLIGADGLHLRLITGLQLWRALWLWHLLAVSFAPWLIWRYYKLHEPFGPAVAASLAGAVYASHTIAVSASFAYIVCAALFGLALSKSPSSNRRLVTFLQASLCLGIAGLWLFHARDLSDLIKIRATETAPTSFYIELLIDPVTVAIFCVATVKLLNTVSGTPMAACVVTATLAVLAAVQWDRRDDLARALETHWLAEHPFARHIPVKSTVYWPDGLPAIWGWLQRSSHYSSLQNAGTLFNRGTAEILGPRREAYRKIDEASKQCRNGALFAMDVQALRGCARPNEALITELCTGAEHPDFMVFRSRVGTSIEPLASWRVDSDSNRSTDFYLYACRQFNTAGQPSATSPSP